MIHLRAFRRTTTGTSRQEFAEAAEKSTIVLVPGHHMQNVMDRRANVALGITKQFGLCKRRVERRLIGRTTCRATKPEYVKPFTENPHRLCDDNEKGRRQSL